ncbi:hypothetical protein AGMMS50267_14420 [Spirochaetia bacterium]|nr:hypothetical protein AGMMS50267_14420 [Spirochaetia bacterium]
MHPLEILENYPELQEVHIRAVLAFTAQRDAQTLVFVHETLDANDYGLLEIL